MYLSQDGSTGGIPGFLREFLVFWKIEALRTHICKLVRDKECHILLLVCLGLCFGRADFSWTLQRYAPEDTRDDEKIAEVPYGGAIMRRDSRFILNHNKFICRDMIRRTAKRLIEIKILWEGNDEA